MCGDRVADSVVLVTTMWDQVNDEQGSRREEELRDKFWKPMLEPGAHMRRFQGTEQSALEIIDSIISRPQTMFYFPRQLKRCVIRY